MPSGKSIRSRPWLARGLAVLLLAFGVAYYATLLYPGLPPAGLLAGGVANGYLALVNGTIYGIAGLLIVSALYRGR